MRYFTFIFCVILLSGKVFSKNYVVNIPESKSSVISGHLKMGNPGPEGKEILINNKYMTIGGQPVIPVMGEMHFSRYPREQWEDALLKMKANGINIVACYVFWIHHEEIEGKFDWSGNKDLHAFVVLCEENGLYVYPRIGPWCHGEVRNGGTPDWILTKPSIKDRSNDSIYQYYADRWYGEVANQLKGLLYKNNGPVIGIQLENEYRRGPGGEKHIMWLKKTAQKYGLDVPMYTVTGWGNASVPQDEVIPLFGGYPAEPWATHINKIEDNPNFTFEAPMNDESIGNEAVIRNRSYIKDYSRYPYLTCELGVGNQLSYHRRPVISAVDGLAIATAKTGSGSNLPGYYVFTGGLNPVGTYTTMEENQDETAYWNEYPDISYDFQAAIRETGELSPAYYKLKNFHYFLNEFGDRLALMEPVIVKDQDAKNDLQFAIRAKDGSGFVFIMNYYRGVKKQIQEDVQFTLNFKNETIIFPQKVVDIIDSSIMIWPVNFKMNDLVLKYASAQPLCHIRKDNEEFWFFVQSKNVIPEFCFSKEAISNIDAGKSNIVETNNQFLVTVNYPSENEKIKVISNKDVVNNIILIPENKADSLWLFKADKEKQFFISSSNLYIDKKDNIHIYSYANDMTLYSFNDLKQRNANDQKLQGIKGNIFTKYSVSVTEKKVQVNILKKDILADALWLKTSVNEVNEKNQLYHKIFIKGFVIDNLSPVKAASFFIYTENYCRIKINDKWININLNNRTLQKLDLTGYFQKGKNYVIMDFPFTTNTGGFASRLNIEYFNSDIDEFYTDTTWLTTEQYIIPKSGDRIRKIKKPEIISSLYHGDELQVSGYNEWNISFPDYKLDGLNNLYLKIDYTGDIGKCYLNKHLISDNFDNGTTWSIEMKHMGDIVKDNIFKLKIYPLKEDYKIYFEKSPVNAGKAEITKLKVIPEYKVVLK